MYKKIIFLLLSIFIISCGKEKTKEKVTEQNEKGDTVRVAEKDAEMLSEQIGENDTVRTNGFILYFEKAEPVTLTDPYNVEEENRVMRDSSIHVRRSEWVEKRVGERFKGIFKRDGEKLILDLEDGKTLSFQNNENELDDEEYIAYNFENFFVNPNYFLLRVEYYECGGYLLINRKNGFKKEVIGRVYFSPSNKRAIAINEDLMAGFVANGFQILSVKGDTLMSEVLVDPGNWSPLNVKWLNEDELILKKVVLHEDEMKYDTVYARLRIEKE